MSPKQWLAFMCFYTSYLFFGASVFYHLEHANETEERAIKLQDRIDINELLVKYTSPDNLDIQNDVLIKLSSYCTNPVTNHTLDEFENPYRWTFYHAVFFSFTVCSTLGYGNISPTRTFGRYFMICYALIGMPVNGILYAHLGSYFGRTFTRIYKRYKAYKLANNKNYVPRRLGMIGQITLCIVPATIVLIFLPACLFTHFEGWPYSISVYYAFVTLTTIGFGDFTPTFQPHQEREFGIYFKFYEAFVLIWFVFGLCYVLMLVGFIARGMRGKRIARLEHQLSENIKITQHRIWDGVTKDVGYLRRILNEVYLMKMKPVYVEPKRKYAITTMARSSSCPELSLYRCKIEVMTRKRAFSENIADPVKYISDTEKILERNSRSDTDLNKIDKKLTFAEGSETYNTAQLLGQVVTALGRLSARDQDLEFTDYNNGMSCFSDHDILESETWSILSTPNTEMYESYAKRRGRAASEVRPPTRNLLNDNKVHEWTWSGINTQQMQQMLRNRKVIPRKENFLQNPLSFSVSIDIDGKSTSPVSNSPIIDRNLPFRKQAIVNSNESYSSRKQNIYNIENYLESTTNGRGSTNSTARRNYLNRTANGRVSAYSLLSYSDENDQKILENTTIADLIRALEMVHTKENTGGNTHILSNLYKMPKRKLGTASPPTHNLLPINNSNSSRRSSIRPLPRYTTIFNSQNLSINQNTSIEVLPKESAPPKRRFSIRPVYPPPYTPNETTKNLVKLQSADMVPRPNQAFNLPLAMGRFSLKPSPLATDPMTKNKSGRRYSQVQQTGTNYSNGKNFIWRPNAQRPQLLSRQGSLKNICEKIENRKRTESN